MTTVPAEAISVFDMLKIGVGPSSSHTLGPWRAVQRWCRDALPGHTVQKIEAHLYGSLALTGRGHATDTAICLALLGHDPVTVDVSRISAYLDQLRSERQLHLGKQSLPFDPRTDIIFHPEESLPEHPNGLRLRLQTSAGNWHSSDYFSVGGGFVLGQGETVQQVKTVQLPFPAQTPSELLRHCEREGLSLAQLTRRNELAWREAAAIDQNLDQLWGVMLDSIHRGCHSEGRLPGGLQVLRRAPALSRKLLGAELSSAALQESSSAWMQAVRQSRPGFAQMLQWLSCFALAVNEENANLGRVVTAPTNGAAGVIPAVLMLHLCFNPDSKPEHSRDFLLVAGEIGSHFKKGATISAAMGGCQAEIGVSSAMAAAALAEVSGGSVRQALMAAEIAMEHHLGLTCDPVGGLVQIPCIERNTMGAVKAVNAALLALASDPDNAKVSLDAVIRTMDQTARDMHSKYKETSQGGLAVNIPVGLAEC